MINPFDKNFFRFLVGFSLILLGSFTVIYIVQKYGASIETLTSSILHR